MNEFFGCNYLWLGVSILLTLFFLGSASLHTLFRLSIYQMIYYGMGYFRHYSISTLVHLDSTLTQAISPMILLIVYLSFPHTSMSVQLCRFWDCHNTLYYEFRLTPLYWHHYKDSIIAEYSESVHLLVRYQSPILTYLIFTRVILLSLILIILSRPCINLLFWSVYSLLASASDTYFYASSLIASWVGRKNSYFERNLIFLFQ